MQSFAIECREIENDIDSTNILAYPTVRILLVKLMFKIITMLGQILFELIL